MTDLSVSLGSAAEQTANHSFCLCFWLRLLLETLLCYQSSPAKAFTTCLEKYGLSYRNVVGTEWHMSTPIDYAR